jgi:hypothetical protein
MPPSEAIGNSRLRAIMVSHFPEGPGCNQELSTHNLVVKRRPPVDYVRHGAVSLPIRYSPVKVTVIDPSAPRVEGAKQQLIEKTYDSYHVDARTVGLGRRRRRPRSW